MIENKLPPVKYFFVGVGKCGTSWIYNFAKKYSLLSIPKIKEPYLIDKVDPEVEIAKLYTSRENMADFSNTYFFDHDNPRKIYEYNPDAKIIITTRKPSDRIVSHFAFLQRNGHFSEMSVEQYLSSGDPESIIQRSEFWNIYSRYIEYFSPRNILILPLELLKENPAEYTSNLCKFLEIEVIVPNDDDAKPVLPRSKARSKILARTAKYFALKLRSMGFLVVLGKLKESKYIRKVLFSEVKGKDESQFGEFQSKLNDLDSQYKNWLGEVVES